MSGLTARTSRQLWGTCRPSGTQTPHPRLSGGNTWLMCRSVETALRTLSARVSGPSRLSTHGTGGSAASPSPGTGDKGTNPPALVSRCHVVPEYQSLLKQPNSNNMINRNGSNGRQELEPGELVLHALCKGQVSPMSRGEEPREHNTEADGHVSKTTLLRHMVLVGVKGTVGRQPEFQVS